MFADARLKDLEDILNSISPLLVRMNVDLKKMMDIVALTLAELQLDLS